MPATPAALGKYALRLSAALLLAACRERGAFPTDVPDRVAGEEMGAARRSVVLDPTPTSCGVDCVLVPGDVPGTSTRPLSTGPNRYTAENSVVWPDTLANATVMLMRVNGVIPRAYVGSMSPSFAYLQGTPYKSIDADGAFSGSFCFGEIRTNFRVFGFVEHTLRSCTLSNTNNDADNLIVAEKVTVGRLRGSGTVLRTGMNQPTWPGWFNCLNGPCVIAAEAQQTITMHPWMDKLALTATPTEVFEGDSVTFTPSVSGGMTMIAGSPRWTWVAHKRAIGGQVQSDPPDTQTGVCANGTVNCKVRIYRTGNMYLRANLNPATIGEQAFAKVVVKPLRLIATPVPRATGSTLDSVRILVRTLPERKLSSIDLNVAPAPVAFRARNVVIPGAPLTSVCDPVAGECTLAGGSVPASLVVSATTSEGITVTTAVTVEGIPCPTGNSILDSKEIRAMMDSLWKSGGDANPAPLRLERTGLLIDSAGILVTRYLDSAGAKPCSTPGPMSSQSRFEPPSFLPGVMKVVASFHTHPFKNGDITPSNCGTLSNQSMGTGPSQADWHSGVYDALDGDRFTRSKFGVDLLAPNYRHVVIEPDHVWLMDAPTAWDKFKTLNGQIYYVPKPGTMKAALSGWDRVIPKTKDFCLAQTTTVPTFLQ